jgi:hypothetical protein
VSWAFKSELLAVEVELLTVESASWTLAVALLPANIILYYIVGALRAAEPAKWKYAPQTGNLLDCF